MPASYLATGPGLKWKQSETGPERVARDIDNHYHLQMTAANTSQLIAYQTQALSLQRDAAIANLRGLAEIAGRQDETNELLGQANGLLSCLVGGIDQLNQGMDALNETLAQTLDAVYAQSEILQQGFRQIAGQMLAQQQTLQQIADILSRPYETQALELLREADRALKTGMKANGRDQQEEFTDATRLLKQVLDNPIGSRNYVAWFQTGWLRWKNESRFAEAEEAFYQAARLSASNADLYHANALRHLAYMQYLQGKYEEAYTTIGKARRIVPDDHDIRYDAARYAARAGREQEALELLDKCIDQRPQTIVEMFSEEDFLQ